MRKSNLLLTALLFMTLGVCSAYAETVVFLTNVSEATSPSDITVIETLKEAGYDVTVKLAKAFDPAADLESVDCIYISEAINSGDPAKLYAAEAAGTVGIGIINNEPYAYTSVRFPWLVTSAVGLSQFNGASASVNIAEAGLEHEIMVNAGIEASGELVIVDPANAGDNPKLSFVKTETVNHGSILATSSDETNAFLVAIDKGTTCDNDFVTTGRRVHFFMGSSSSTLTADGKAILLSTVAWCIAGNESSTTDPNPNPNPDTDTDDTVEGTVVFLTNTSHPSSPADTTVIVALEKAGYEVTAKYSKSFDPTTDLEGVDCIYISETIGSGDPAKLYAAEVAGEIGVGIINNEPYAYTSDRLPWITASTVGVDSNNASSAIVYVTDEGLEHEIMVNAGIEATGELVVLDPATEGSNTKLSRVLTAEINQGTIIATNGGEAKTYFAAIEKGTVCDNNYVTTGRRVHFFMGNGINKLTEAGEAVLLSTVAWCIAGNETEGGTVGIAETTAAQCKYANNTLVIEQEASIELFTISGELCAAQNNTTSFDCSSLNKGVYVARVSFSNGNTETCKIMVK